LALHGPNPGPKQAHLKEENTMSKVQKTNKETKKQSSLSPKEKKAVKQAKKTGKDAPKPFVTPKD
jgi:hypothetical protein